MPQKTRRQIQIARRLALIATLALRGRSRAAAWGLHEVLRLGPTLWRNSPLHGPVAHRFRTSKPEVWLTIDDGPDPDQTPQVLEMLSAADAKASFFVIGKHVDAHRGLTRRMVAEGHSVENHTYSHPSGLFWAMPCCAVRDEIERCGHAIRVATGVAPSWFRSPAGLTNGCVHPVTAENWLRVAGWSAAGRDGLPGAQPRDVVARISERLTPGAIVLLHDGVGRRCVETLGLLLEEMAARGLRCVVPRGADVE